RVARARCRPSGTALGGTSPERHTSRTWRGFILGRDTGTNGYGRQDPPCDFAHPAWTRIPCASSVARRSRRSAAHRPHTPSAWRLGDQGRDQRASAEPSTKAVANDPRGSGEGDHGDGQHAEPDELA